MNDSEEDSVYSLNEIAAHHGRRKVSTVACLWAADDGVTGIQYFSRMLAGSDQPVKRQFSLQDDWLLVVEQNELYDTFEVEGEMILVRGPPPSSSETDESLYLCPGGNRSPSSVHLSPILTGLYVLSASRVLDVWPCDCTTGECSSMQHKDIANVLSCMRQHLLGHQ